MPTYEYKCTACNHAFEQFQSMTAPPVKRCPKCGKSKVKRLISTGAGLIFKGSGFYITDYRDSSYTDRAKAESGGDSSGGGDSKAELKSDAKPAETKADAKPAAKADAPKAEVAKSSSSKASGKSEKKSKK
jgi:putative FmdB family regulatory protein